MAKPYSNDLRERVIEAIEEGATREETAERHHVSLSSVGRFLRLKRETGSVSPAQFGGYKPYSVLATQKVKVGQTSIFRFLRHLNLSFKKKPSRRRAGSTRRRGRSSSLAKEAAKA